MSTELLPLFRLLRVGLGLSTKVARDSEWHSLLASSTKGSNTLLEQGISQSTRVDVELEEIFEESTELVPLFRLLREGLGFSCQDDARCKFSSKGSSASTGLEWLVPLPTVDSKPAGEDVAGENSVLINGCAI